MVTDDRLRILLLRYVLLDLYLYLLQKRMVLPSIVHKTLETLCVYKLLFKYTRVKKSNCRSGRASSSTNSAPQREEIR